MLLRAIVQTSIWLGFFAIVLFASAGNWLWPQAWAYIAIFAVGSAGFTAWLLPRDPALLQARMEPLKRKGQPVWDRLFLLFFIAVWIAWLAFMGLDARRWHWSHMPVAVNVVGGLLIIAGFLATAPVFKANSFAEPMVRLQTDREQHVIDTGPYAYVRHPMYAAAILYLFGMPLLLGSEYGLPIAPLFIIGMSLRAIAEERKLARELPGYADYMARVRYWLIPFVW